jgi:PAS domain S-box-containing protein
VQEEVDMCAYEGYEGLSPEAAIRESEQRCRNLREYSSDLIGILVEGRLVNLNPAGCRLFGAAQPEEMLHKSVADFVHPDDLPQVRLRMQRIKETGHPNPRSELRFLKLDGTLVYVEEVSVPIHYKRQPAIQIICHDITAYKQAEGSFQQEHELYADLIKAEPIGLYRVRIFPSKTWKPDAWLSSTNAPFVLEMVNDRFCEILGINKEACAKNPGIVNDLVYLEDKVSFAKCHEEAMAHPTQAMWEGRLVINDQIRWVHLESTPRVFENGDVVWTGILQDITARKVAEHQARERAKELRAFYMLSELTTMEDITLEQLCQKFSDILPQSWQYPEIAYTRILIGDSEFRSSNFRKSAWKQSAPIKVHGAVAGLLEVGYREEKPEEHEGPFLKDERLLLDSIAERLGRIAERMQAENMLQDSARRFRALVENLSEAIALLGPDGSFLYASPAAGRINGYAEEEFMGRNAFEVIHPDDQQLVGQAFQQIQQTPSASASIHFRLQHRNGNWCWIEAVATNLLGDPAIAAIVVNYRDITERKQAKEALEESNELLSHFISHSPFYAFIKEVTSTESRVLRASDNYQDMIGIPGAAMTGKTMGELFPPEFATKITADDWAVVSNNKVLVLDENLNGRNYTTIKFPIVIGSKHLLAGYTMDITERKRAEAELQASEAKYRRLHETMMDAFVSVDMTGRIMDSNAAYQVMLGYTAAELKQLKYPDLTPEQWHAVESEIVEKQILPRGYSDVYEKEYRKKDGTIFPVELRTFLLRDSTGQPCEMWAIIRDITKRKHLEAQLLHAQKLEAVGQLAGGVAHDFNNKLQAILGFTDVIKDNLPPEHPTQADLQIIEEAARHSADLTSQLLAFSRKQIMQPMLLDMNEAIANSLRLIRRLIGKNIRLNFSTVEELWPVFMDPSQVDQILTNLAINARDAISETGNIFIEVANRTLQEAECRDKIDFVPPGDYVVLTCRDDGSGMTPEVLAHIFEPFFTTKELGKGTGMGLATVYGIVKQNHGAISVASTPGQGTIFTIYLPNAKGKINDTNRLIAKQSYTGTETILLVEDEEAILSLAQRTLTKQGYTVLAALTPKNALQLCEQHPDRIHLLLSDVIMPEMSGKVLAELIKKKHPDIRILYMSGYTAEILTQDGHLVAGQHVLQKPFSSVSLTQCVRTALDMPP